MFMPGDNVKILGTENDFLRQYIGTIGEVIESGDEDVLVKVHGGTRDKGWWFRYNHLSFVSKPIPEFFDKATALKLSIDGHKITRELLDGFFVFNGVDFTIKYSSGYEEKASAILNYEDNWCLYKEPTLEPKFSKGDFVSTTSGKLGLIVDKPQYYNNKFLYSVRFNFLSKSNATSRTTPELQLRKVDKELLKEASEEYSLSI